MSDDPYKDAVMDDIMAVIRADTFRAVPIEGYDGQKWIAFAVEQDGVSVPVVCHMSDVKHLSLRINRALKELSRRSLSEALPPVLAAFWLSGAADE